MEFLRAAGPGAERAGDRRRRVHVPAGGEDRAPADPRRRGRDRPRRDRRRVLAPRPRPAPATSASFNMDGRQFVAERAAPGTYDLITLDAVNDLSVPYHLLTRECNDAVKRVLAPGGVYLVTVIDYPERGRLWKAAVHTLRQTFAHVELLLSPGDEWDADGPGGVRWSTRPTTRSTWMRCGRRPASRRPTPRRRSARRPPRPRSRAWFTHRPPPGEVDRLLAAEPPLVLTDQFAPVDNLMADVFRHRKEERKSRRFQGHGPTMISQELGTERLLLSPPIRHVLRSPARPIAVAAIGRGRATSVREVRGAHPTVGDRDSVPPGREVRRPADGEPVFAVRADSAAVRVCRPGRGPGAGRTPPSRRQAVDLERAHGRGRWPANATSPPHTAA